jgi:hypothetical protein
MSCLILIACAGASNTEKVAPTDGSGTAPRGTDLTVNQSESVTAKRAPANTATSNATSESHAHSFELKTSVNGAAKEALGLAALSPRDLNTPGCALPKNGNDLAQLAQAQIKGSTTEKPNFEISSCSWAQDAKASLNIKLMLVMNGPLGATFAQPFNASDETAAKTECENAAKAITAESNMQTTCQAMPTE